MRLEIDKYENKLHMYTSKLIDIADNIEELRLGIWGDLKSISGSKTYNDNLLFKIQSDVREVSSNLHNEYDVIPDDVVEKRKELEEKIKTLKEELKSTYI